MSNNNLWRVGEFYSSSTPTKKVLCLVLGDDIERDEKREDFVQWVSPIPAREGRGRYMSDPEIEWTEFWRDIVAPDGVLDVEQVKKELSDFSMLMHQVPTVYMHATGGMISYPHTMADSVCSAIDDHISERCTDDDTQSELDESNLARHKADSLCDQMVAALTQIAAITKPQICMDGNAIVGSPNATGYNFALIARAALATAGAA